MGAPFMTGAAIGLDDLPGFTFRSEAGYRVCLICGDIFQTDLDRALATALKGSYKFDYYNNIAKTQRDRWAERHAKTHSEKAHAELKLSGQFCTPEAAIVLAPFGIIPLDPNEDVAQAMLEAKRAPTNDSEGG